MSTLGRKLVEDRGPMFVEKRIKCDKGEPCREVCPANAIAYNGIITANCIECALCTEACPYGAINIDCNGKIEINTNICETHNGKKKTNKPCNLHSIKAEEIIMQNWLKSLFLLSDLPAEIPGVGEYPDIVTAEVPSFIEVKNERITKKRAQRLINNQLPRYMESRVIYSTINRLIKRKNFPAQKPQFFVVIAPISDDAEYLLQNAKRSVKIKYPVSFVAFEGLYKSSEMILEGKKISLKNFWEQIEPWNIYSNVIKY